MKSAKYSISQNCYVFFAALVGVFIFTADAHAFRFQQDEIKGFIDTTISSGSVIRVKSKKHGLIGIVDGGTAHAVGQEGDRSNLVGVFRKYDERGQV